MYQAVPPGTNHGFHSRAHTHTHVESLNDWGGWWRTIYLVLLLVLVWTRRMRRGRGGVTTSYAKHIHVIQSSIHWKCSHKVEMLMVLLLYVPAAAVVAREKYSFASFEIFFSFFSQIIVSLFDWLWRQQQQLLHELQLYSGIDTTASPTCAFLCRFYLWMLLDAVLPPSQRHTLAVGIVLFFQFIYCFHWTKFG